MKAISRKLAITLTCWAARALVLGVLLLWGAFFLPVAGSRALVFVGLTILPVLLVARFDRLRRADKPRIQAAA